MGLLVDGLPLPPDEMRKAMRYIREHGVIQFLNNWKREKSLENFELKFGDEIECGVFEVDKVQKTVKLAYRGAEINSYLTEKEHQYAHEAEGCVWHPEFGAWMVESTPGRPYSHFASDLLRIERNMTLRRRRLLAALRENEIAPTVTCFPLMGVGDFIANPQPFSAPYSQSRFVPDYIINPHPRFAALATNIRERRGKKVDIRVPLYRDIKTPEFLEDKNFTIPAGYTYEEDGNIYMDCMAFGMGMCCLQVTFQAQDVSESRYMYDQLAVLAPIMLALTAATPIFKGRLADIDARWTVISQSVDDRTDAEKGLLSPEEAEKAANPLLAGSGIRRIPKSRYDSVSTYIYHCEGECSRDRTFAQYNDIPCPIEQEFKDKLLENGVDENLAHHVAHLFIRDPIVAYAGKVELNDEVSTDHFESIQSTNWQSCRWKPPPFQPVVDEDHIGWRTEFRSMEVQLTDFENAAFTVFILLITRVMLAFDLGLYIPISRVDENMKRAHKRNAVLTEKFFFRKYIAPPDVIVKENSHEKSTADVSPQKFCCGGGPMDLSPEDEYEEMTMTEIFLGKADYYPGLLPLVYAYLDFINCDPDTFQRVNEYLKFIEKRVTGELITPATWIRRFVKSHPDYKNDSFISSSIAHDLLVTCQGIGEGSIACPELLGNFRIAKIRKEDAYGHVLAGKLSPAQRSELLQSLIERAHIPRSNKVPRGKSRTYSDSFAPTPPSPSRYSRISSEENSSKFL